MPRFRLMSVYREMYCDRDVCLDLKVCQKMTCNTGMRKMFYGHAIITRGLSSSLQRVVREREVFAKTGSRARLPFIDTCLV